MWYTVPDIYFERTNRIVDMPARCLVRATRFGPWCLARFNCGLHLPSVPRTHVVRQPSPSRYALEVKRFVRPLPLSADVELSKRGLDEALSS